MRKWLFFGLIALSGCDQSPIKFLQSKQTRAENVVKEHLNFSANPKKFAHTWFTKVTGTGKPSYTIGLVDTVPPRGGDNTLWFSLDSSLTKVEYEYTN